MKFRKIIVAVLFLVFCVAVGAADRKYVVKPRSGDRKGLPFSEGVLVGNTLCIAGHIWAHPKANMPPERRGGGPARDGRNQTGRRVCMIVYGRRGLHADLLH